MNAGSPTPRHAHFEVVRSDGEDRDQPWHARIQAANGEITWTTETYVDRASAEKACGALSSMLSPSQRSTTYHGPDGLSYVEMWLDDQELGQKIRIEVQYVDERTPASTEHHNGSEGQGTA